MTTLNLIINNYRPSDKIFNPRKSVGVLFSAFSLRRNACKKTRGKVASLFAVRLVVIWVSASPSSALRLRASAPCCAEPRQWTGFSQDVHRLDCESLFLYVPTGIVLCRFRACLEQSFFRVISIPSGYNCLFEEAIPYPPKLKTLC